MMRKVVLDLAAFKALASETRLDILKLLDERPHTVSELARALDRSKANVHEHLSVLVSSELVTRSDDANRKWVYYRLTWRGQSIVAPERRQVAIFLAFSATLLISAFAYALWLLVDLARITADANVTLADSGYAVQGADVAPVVPLGGFVIAGLALLSSLFAALLAWDAWRRRGPSPIDEIREALRD